MKKSILFLLGLIIYCASSFAQTVTITTQNKEQFDVEITAIKESFIRFKQTTINGRLMEKLPQDYISSIRFPDNFTLRFDKGVLDRSNLLEAPSIKKGEQYKVENLIALNEDEMISLLGTNAYYNGFLPRQRLATTGLLTALTGTGSILFAHILSLSLSRHPVTEDETFIEAITNNFEYSMHSGTLIANKMGLSLVVAGLTELTVGSIGLHRFNHHFDQISFPSLQQQRKRFYWGAALAVAGTATTLGGILLWNDSFNPARQYSYFGDSFHPYYQWGVDSAYMWEKYISNEKSGSLTGMWMALFGTAAASVGLSLAIPAIPALKNADKFNLACGFTPYGYGLTLNF
jgi:hypothetical protein